MSMNAASIAALRRVSIVASRTRKRVGGGVGRSIKQADRRLRGRLHSLQRAMSPGRC